MSTVETKYVIELDEDDSYDKRCCEIYITRKRYLLFHCLFCKSVLDSFNAFLKHLQEQHHDDNRTIQEEESDDEAGTFSINEDGSMELHVEDTNTEEPYLCFIEEDGNADLLEEHDIIIEEKIYPKQTEAESIDNYESQITNSNQVKVEEDDTIQNTKDATLMETTIIRDVDGIVCEKCNQTFYSDRLYQKHMGMFHSTDRKYKCKVCGVAFKEIFNLRTHIRRHMNLKDYTCTFCPKQFHTKTEQLTHERRHTGERPFVCSECGLTFITSGALNEHSKRHKGFRPHQCAFCSKRFFDAGQLKSHAAVHSKTRLYTCDVCNATFPRRKSLSSHKKLHENKREYECHLCSANFNQRPALYTHLRNRHKIVKGSMETEEVTIDYLEILGK